MSPADPWRRLMSTVYESIILFGIVFFFGYGFSALTQYRGDGGPLLIAFQGFLFVVIGAYFVGFWSLGRWTLPMKTMGITLVTSADGAPVSYLRASWRYLVASIFFWGLTAAVWRASPWWLLLWPVPFAWAIFDSRRRTLYDVVAGTMLVRRDPIRPAQAKSAVTAG
jgi:uncharacterized RDD family membrane protein YckC